MLFIPIGTIFYGAINLNFTRFASVDMSFIFLMFIIFIVYIISVLLLSSLFSIKEKTCYLITVGSAICGASAIAITSKAIDAEPDDVSNSLIPVFLSALIGLFVMLPLAASYFQMSGMYYGVLSGTILQFTGFVKAASAQLSSEIRTIALSVKAVRYIGLLFLVPLFASFVKGRFYIPWYLWAFLVSGIIFSLMPDLSKSVKPIFKPTLTILWSIAMGAIGLNASLKALMKKEGLKAIAVSFLAFMIALVAFLAGIYFVTQ